MTAKITVNANGPIKVEGEFLLLDAQGVEFQTQGKTSVFLCRCGQTKKNPFCDGSHKSCGFLSESTAH